MKVLLLNQCFYPDVVSTAQHLTDLAVKLAEQGHDVTVVASRRGYDNPEMRFPKQEVWKNIRIIRVPSMSLGKRSKWRRAVNFGSFLISCIFRLILLPRFDLVIALTSPPLISFLGALLTHFKGGRFVFWVMDLNPDEAIAAGWLKEQSLVARVLGRLLRYSLQQAAKIVVLDRFMKQRITAKGIPEHKIEIIPPWSHDDAVRYDEEGRLEFRARHHLTGKYVVMYSGNHSPCHPLNTVLNAARQLADHPEIAFCFIGGGSEFQKVKAFARAHRLENILCLPYQPLEKLAASLSAADMHVVVMGDPFKGIVHPCKIYNILMIGAPFLYIGPAESHVVDIVSQRREGVTARIAQHGEVETVVKHIIEGAQAAGALKSKPRIEQALSFSKEVLLLRMVEALEVTPDKLAGCSDLSGSSPTVGRLASGTRRPC